MIDFARYLRGAVEKRKALEQSREMLACKIACGQTDLFEAFAELKKLEHLMETNQRELASERRQREAAIAAEITAMRRRV
jgi:hypothetical protein